MTDDSNFRPKRTMHHQARSIGNRKLKPATMMMGHGYDPRLSEGALKPPIFLTSTFVFESAADGKRFFEGVTGVRPGGSEGLVYGRFNGPDQEILEDRLALWEDAEEALTFSSGMSAIATTFLALVKPGDIIVHSAPLYAATETLIGRILGKLGVTWLDFPAGATQAEIESVIAAAKSKGRIAAIYLESPANPTNALVDVEAVCAARAAVLGDGELPPIVIDNTFLGPLWAQPLAQGADVTIYSLTKYVGGHSDLVAGACIGAGSMAFAQEPVISGKIDWGLWVDADGCQHWWADGGTEGYMVPRRNPDTGKPVCTRQRSCLTESADAFFICRIN